MATVKVDSAILERSARFRTVSLSFDSGLMVRTVKMIASEASRINFKRDGRPASKASSSTLIETRNSASQFGVRSIPTLPCFKGRCCCRHQGLRSFQDPLSSGFPALFA